MDSHRRPLLCPAHAAVGHTDGAPPDKAHPLMAQCGSEGAARRAPPAAVEETAPGKSDGLIGCK